MALTCISCKVIFATADLQREHYKNDWHRYNLKRKIAELQPVTKEEFDKRAAIYNTDLQEDNTNIICEVCHKSFVSNNSWLNHIKSKKHIETQKNENIVRKVISTTPSSKVNVSEEVVIVDNEEEADDSDWESCDEDEEDTSIPPNFCLFCLLEHKSLEDNIQHMTLEHSFFIPDIEYLIDLEGLITYLGHKIGNGHLCLWCDDRGKSFHSTKSAQQHMIDKGHCKILHEGEALLSYTDFYDYSSSYPDAGDKDSDEEVIPYELDDTDYELVLPSGAVIGHRSLARYYKQNLPLLKPEKHSAISNVVHHYRSLGWVGISGEAAVRKAKDLKFMQKMQAKHRLKLGVKQNKFQPHFRPQILF